MNKFWSFEKDSIAKFVADRPNVDVTDFLSEKEVKIVEEDLKYGTLEYIGDSLTYRPSKEDANVILVTLVVGNNDPKVLLKNLLTSLRTPFSIAIDFWCISESENKGALVLYPSFGTRYNKKTYMKWDHQVDELLDSIETDGIKDKIYNAHASARPAISRSGVQVKKVMSMWVRLSKTQIRLA